MSEVGNTVWRFGSGVGSRTRLGRGLGYTRSGGVITVRRARLATTMRLTVIGPVHARVSDRG
jgi:hypothetical protein